MHLAEVVQDYPSVIGSVDAAKLGMGGVLFAPGHPPTLWHATFPPEIQAHIVSLNNQLGAGQHPSPSRHGSLPLQSLGVDPFDSE